MWGRKAGGRSRATGQYLYTLQNLERYMVLHQVAHQYHLYTAHLTHTSRTPAAATQAVRRPLMDEWMGEWRGCGFSLLSMLEDPPPPPLFAAVF